MSQSVLFMLCKVNLNHVSHAYMWFCEWPDYLEMRQGLKSPGKNKREKIQKMLARDDTMESYGVQIDDVG